jgi:3-deoxy-D-manno-octulosonic-acid transferase
MWQRLYRFFIYLALPFVLLRLWVKQKSMPAYASRIPERFGFQLPTQAKGCLWIHTVSVGEFLAARPFILALLKERTEPILVTTMTPTGSQCVQTHLADQVLHCYAPYDFGFCVRRFLHHTQPKALILFETEIWPNWLFFTHQKKIPALLVNARLSQRSFERYQKWRPLVKAVLSKLSMIIANERSDVDRFRALGVTASHITATGNVKFDLEIAPEAFVRIRELKSKWPNRLAWIAASTHEGEEEIILNTHAQLLKKHPTLLLILVPRHPERSEKIIQLLEQKHLSFERKTSLGARLSPHSQVLLGDTLGELLIMYGASDASFVGGSLVARGGHNILEPIALNIPVIVGSYVFNFQEIIEKFLKAECIFQVKDASALVDAIEYCLLQKENTRLKVEKAHALFLENKGALQRQLTIVSDVIARASS